MLQDTVPRGPMSPQPGPDGRLRALVIGALLGAVTGIGVTLAFWRPANARRGSEPSRQEIRRIYPTGDFGRRPSHFEFKPGPARKEAERLAAGRRRRGGGQTAPRAAPGAARHRRQLRGGPTSCTRVFWNDAIRHPS